MSSASMKTRRQATKRTKLIEKKYIYLYIYYLKELRKWWKMNPASAYVRQILKENENFKVRFGSTMGMQRSRWQANSFLDWETRRRESVDQRSQGNAAGDVGKKATKWSTGLKKKKKKTNKTQGARRKPSCAGAQSVDESRNSHAGAITSAIQANWCYNKCNSGKGRCNSGPTKRNAAKDIDEEGKERKEKKRRNENVGRNQMRKKAEQKFEAHRDLRILHYEMQDFE